MNSEKPTVLVVDDEESVREILRDHLATNCHVLEAGNGYDALSEVMMANPPVDLVVADLKMRVRAIAAVARSTRGRRSARRASSRARRATAAASAWR